MDLRIENYLNTRNNNNKKEIKCIYMFETMDNRSPEYELYIHVFIKD